MLTELQEDAKKRMQKSIDALKGDLTKLRTGRAHPSLLEHIKVDYYGVETPLSQVSNITVENSRSLMVTPWEKTMVDPIDKALRNADLGLNPAVAGTVIRVPLPALTEERRKDLIRIVKDEAERARVSIRNVRRDCNQTLKELQKEKEISEDEARRSETDVQKLTDQFIAQVEKIVVNKESDLMEV